MLASEENVIGRRELYKRDGVIWGFPLPSGCCQKAVSLCVCSGSSSASTPSSPFSFHFVRLVLFCAVRGGDWALSPASAALDCLLAGVFGLDVTGLCCSSCRSLTLSLLALFSFQQKQTLYGIIMQQAPDSPLVTCKIASTGDYWQEMVSLGASSLLLES